MKHEQKILVASIALVLGGCASPQVRVADVAVEKTSDRASAAVAQVGEVVAREVPKPVLRSKDAVWMPVKKYERSINPEDQRLLNRTITINRDFGSIMEVAQRLTMLFGVPVTVAKDALDISVSSPGQPAGVLSAPPQVGQAGASTSTEIVSIAYSGSLSGFLDIVAARYGLSWQLNDGKISVYRNITRTFVMKAVPGNAAFSSKVSTGSTSGGAASASETTLSASTLSVWQSVENGVKSMLTDKGRVVVSPATGTVTVTDAPAAMKSVEAFIEQQNAHLSRQVTVQVQVLSVSLDESDSYGINWDAVWKSMGGNYSVALGNLLAPPAGATGLTFSVPDTATGNMAKWAGSSAIISALAKQGKVSVVTSVTAVTLNNQPVPVQVGRQTGYLASSTTTLSNGTSSTSITPGTLNTGFSLTVLPHIQDAENLFLQYSVDISNLLELKQITSGGSTIQTPDIETRNFMQRIGLKSGETLVLAGFESAQNSASTQGVGNARFPLLGGSQNGINNKNIIVVLLRPILSANK